MTIPNTIVSSDTKVVERDMVAPEVPPDPNVPNQAAKDSPAPSPEELQKAAAAATAIERRRQAATQPQTLDATPGPKPAPAPEVPPGPAPEAGARKAARKQTLQDLADLAARTKAKYLEQEKAKIAAAESARKTETLEAEVRRLRAQAELAEKDPLGYLDSRGIRAKDVVDRVVKSGTPEAEAEKAHLAMAEELAGLKAELRDRQAREEASAQESARRQEFEAARANLVHTFREGKQTYEALHSFVDDPDEVVDEVLSLIGKLKANPSTRDYAHLYSNDELLTHINSKYQSKLDRIRGPQTPAATAQAKVAHQAATSGSGSPPPKTLTQQHSSETLSLPPDFDKLSDSKQNAVLADLLRRGWRGEPASTQ